MLHDGLEAGKEIDFGFGAYGLEGWGLAIPVDRPQLIDGMRVVLGELVVSLCETGQGIPLLPDTKGLECNLDPVFCTL
jgi:hypothetical protein